MEGHGTARLARVLCGVHLRLVLLPRKRVLRLSSLFIGKMKEERPVINSTDKARLSPLFLKSSSSSLALVSWGLMGNICLRRCLDKAIIHLDGEVSSLLEIHVYPFKFTC